MSDWFVNRTNNMLNNMCQRQGAPVIATIINVYARVLLYRNVTRCNPGKKTLRTKAFVMINNVILLAVQQVFLIGRGYPGKSPVLYKLHF